jgi:O-antigen/teichoic acid export membrane protein
MTVEEVKRNIYRNTVSNYVYLGLRLVLGLVLFRLLYKELSYEEFGFWGLLWSVFGYGVLLDFGFGFTAQKRVAELSVHQDWLRLSKVLSTIFYSYVAVGAGIVAAGFLGAEWLIGLINVTPENQRHFREIMLLFFVGLGIAFPLGLFPEMLRGQQRIALANTIFAIALIANFVLVLLAVHYRWGLKSLFIIALLCTFVPDLLCALFAFGRMPQVKLRLRYFSRHMVRDTMSFSLYAYITTVSNLIMGKTDQLIISSAISVAAVAFYQAAAKVAEMFAHASQQLPETFSPVAAHLHAKGDRGVIQQLMIKGTRFTVMVATPIYLICAFHMESLLRLLTGGKIVENFMMTFWVGQVLLLWSYISIVTQSVSKRIYMMCGHEKRLTLLGAGEALLNLGLSVGLILYFRNILSVAVASLVSSFIFGCLLLWPWVAREVGISPWRLAGIVLGPTWLACLPLVGLFALERAIFVPESSLLWLLLGSLLALSIAAVGLWKLALTALERERFAAFVIKLINKRKTA